MYIAETDGLVPIMAAAGQQPAQRRMNDLAPAIAESAAGQQPGQRRMNDLVPTMTAAGQHPAQRRMNDLVPTITVEGQQPAQRRMNDLAQTKMESPAGQLGQRRMQQGRTTNCGLVGGGCRHTVTRPLYNTGCYKTETGHVLSLTGCYKTGTGHMLPETGCYKTDTGQVLPVTGCSQIRGWTETGGCQEDSSRLQAIIGEEYGQWIVVE